MLSKSVQDVLKKGIGYVMYHPKGSPWQENISKSKIGNVFNEATHFLRLWN